MLENAVQAQCNNNLELNSLRFFNEGFVHYLWHDLLTLNAVVVRSRLPRRQICLQISFNLKLEYNGTSIIGPQLTRPSIIQTPQGCSAILVVNIIIIYKMME